MDERKTKEEDSHRAGTKKKPRGVTPHRWSALQAIKWALQLPYVPGHNMGIYLGGLHVCMAEDLLKHADVHSVFQHVCGEAVTKGMAAGLFVDPGLLCSLLHCLLQP